MFRSVGKAYIQANKSSIEKALDKEKDSLLRNQSDLNDRKEFLERRIKQNTQNLKELTGN